MPEIQATTPEELLGSLTEVERKKAPKQLYIAGDRSLFEATTRVSVVGSRQASEEGRRRAAVLVRALVERGIVVVSGLAEGIDTVAHETAIRLGGRTTAILGTGLDEVFPEENRRLQERIIEGHLAVSQFRPGTAPQRGNFPMRNRTMALLTDSTVIVEAGDKSGTLHQGWEALRLGRPLMLMESVAKDPALSWPEEMIRYGAQVLTRENLGQVLDDLPRRSRGQAIPF